MIRVIISLLLLALLLPVSILGCNGGATENRGNAMQEVKIPAIDARPPAITATATFALG